MSLASRHPKVTPHTNFPIRGKGIYRVVIPRRRACRLLFDLHPGALKEDGAVVVSQPCPWETAEFDTEFAKPAADLRVVPLRTRAGYRLAPKAFLRKILDEVRKAGHEPAEGRPGELRRGAGLSRQIEHEAEHQVLVRDPGGQAQDGMRWIR